MSTQLIELVHTNRDLPKVDNPTWKISSDEAGPSKKSTEAPSVPITDASDTSSTADGFDNNSSAVPAKKSTQTYIGHKIPEEFLKKAGLLGNTDADDASYIESLYELNEDGSVLGKRHKSIIENNIFEFSKRFFNVFLIHDRNTCRSLRSIGNVWA